MILFNFSFRYGFILCFVLSSAGLFAGKEGWSWRQSFDTEVEGRTISSNRIHVDLAEQESLLYEELKRQKGSKIGANILLASMSLLIMDGTGIHMVTKPIGKNEKNLAGSAAAAAEPPYRPLLFLSGQAFNKASKPLINDDRYSIIAPAPAEELFESVHRTAKNALESQELSSESDPSSAVISTQVVRDLYEETENAVKRVALISQLIEKYVGTGEEERTLTRGKGIDDNIQKQMEKIQEEISLFDRAEKQFVELRVPYDQSSFVNALGILSLRAIILQYIKNERGIYNDEKEKYIHTEQNFLYYMQERNFLDEFLVSFCEEQKRRKTGVVFLGSILHLHSRLDICERCAPVIFLEMKRIGHIVKRILGDFNPKGSRDPLFHALASVREPLADGHRRRTGHDGRFCEAINLMDPTPHFYMKTIEPFDPIAPVPTAEAAVAAGAAAASQRIEGYH